MDINIYVNTYLLNYLFMDLLNYW